MPLRFTFRSRIEVTLALGVSVIACSPPTPPADKRPETNPPTVQLVSPESEGRFQQNDLTLGCTPHSARGSGFRVAFDWKDVRAANRYRVVFWQRNAQFPAIARDVTTSEYEEINCNAFVMDRNLDEWVWKVAAMGPIPGSETDSGTVARDTILWSEEREFGFEPCRLEDDRPCYAPPSPEPSVEKSAPARPAWWK